MLYFFPRRLHRPLLVIGGPESMPHVPIYNFCSSSLVVDTASPKGKQHPVETRVVDSIPRKTEK